MAGKRRSGLANARKAYGCRCYNPATKLSPTASITIDIESIATIDINQGINVYILNGNYTINESQILNIQDGIIFVINEENTLTNRGTIYNNSSIFNYARGTIYNTGIINNNESGYIYNSDLGIINNYGIINNNGFINNYIDSTIMNNGTINNRHFIYTYYATTTNNNTINNTGYIYTFYDGTTINNGTINNTGGTISTADGSSVCGSGTLIGTGTITGGIFITSCPDNINDF